MRHLPLLLLALLNVAIAGAVGYQWVDVKTRQLKSVRWVEPRQVDLPKDATAVSAVTLAKLDVAGMTTTNERPLFFYTRKPPAPVPVPVPPPPPPPPPPPDPLASLELYGLVDLGGGKGGVIAKVDGKLKQLHFGDQLGEWTLSGAEGRDALFANAAGTKRKVAMTYRSQLAAAAASASGPAAASPVAPQAKAPAAPTSFDQVVLEHRANINAARARAGLKPIEQW